MDSTLRLFLSLSLRSDAERSALVSAAELDPAILLALLRTWPGAAANLGRWHESMGEAILQAVAISMSSAAVVRSVEPPELARSWRNSLMRGFLAAELAGRAGNMNTIENRLTALLSGVGNWLDPSGDAGHAAAAGADYLETLGCTPSVCDAVRYQHEPLERLQGTSSMLRVNAIAARLLAYTHGPEMIESGSLRHYNELLELDEDQIYEVIGRASRNFDLSIERLKESAAQQGDEKAIDYLARVVASVNTGAVFYRALMKSAEQMGFEELLDQAGRFLFGFGDLCHLRPVNSVLSGVLAGGEAIEIDSQRQGSTIARSFREQSIVVGAADDNLELVERQLLGRFRSDHFICLPLGSKAGVLVCAVDASFAQDLDSQRPLLSALSEAAADLYAKRAEGDADVIGLDYLRRRVREITHEVNNPLAIVQNYLGSLSLKLGKDTPVQKDIDAIARELMRVGTIVQKYGRVGKPEELAFRRVDLNALIEELVDIVQGGRSDLTIEKWFDQSIPVMELPADALSQVVLNLLKNAAEALTDMPGARIDVFTQGAVNVDGRHYIEIVISDNGPGMSQEQRLQLFTSEASTKGEGRGYGLGIVKQLLGDMSATISCRENTSFPGPMGTTFQILLPLEQHNEGKR